MCVRMCMHQVFKNLLTVVESQDASLCAGPDVEEVYVFGSHKS